MGCHGRDVGASPLNVATACLRCNIKKGSKAAAEQLALIG